MAKRLKRAAFRLPIHLAFEQIRYATGWTKKQLAYEIGLRPQAYYPYETGSKDPPLWVVEQVREATGLDPYVLAYGLYYDAGKQPEAVRETIRELRDKWMRTIEWMHNNRRLAPSSWL